MPVHILSSGRVKVPFPNTRGSSVVHPAPRRFAFIDGASFERSCVNIIKDLFDIKCDKKVEMLEYVDFHKVTKVYERVFYYDALPAPKLDGAGIDGRRNKKIGFFEKLSTVPKLHVRPGLTTYERKDSLTQKGVDVLLAIELLQHAIGLNMDAVFLYASDLDFLPLLEALVSTRVVTHLIYDPAKTNQNLIQAADFHQAIEPINVVNWLRESKQEFVRIDSRTGSLPGDFRAIATAEWETYKNDEMRRSKVTFGVDQLTGSYISFLTSNLNDGKVHYHISKSLGMLRARMSSYEQRFRLQDYTESSNSGL